MYVLTCSIISLSSHTSINIVHFTSTDSLAGHTHGPQMAFSLRHCKLQSDYFGNLRQSSSSTIIRSVWELLVSRSIHICDWEKAIALIQFVARITHLLCSSQRRVNGICRRRCFPGCVGLQVDIAGLWTDFFQLRGLGLNRAADVPSLHSICETQ